MALLAGIMFVSCNKDDDGGGSNNCVTCTIMEQNMEVCNQDGNAFVDGQDSGMEFDQYIEIAEMGGADCN